jgi:hypothetical protein
MHCERCPYLILLCKRPKEIFILPVTSLLQLPVRSLKQLSRKELSALALSILQMDPPGRRDLTRTADFSLTPVIDMNWLVRLFWADFEAMLLESLPQQAGGLRGWW